MKDLTYRAGERHVFVYNTENTLTGMYVYTGSTLTYEAHYGYNPLGRRIEKRETDHTGGKTNIEQYVYRDEDIAFRIIVDPNTGERAVNQVYTHGELAVDDPVAFSDCPNTVCSSGGWSFLAKDQVHPSKRYLIQTLSPAKLNITQLLGLVFSSQFSPKSLYSCMPQELYYREIFIHIEQENMMLRLGGL